MQAHPEGATRLATVCSLQSTAVYCLLSAVFMSSASAVLRVGLLFMSLIVLDFYEFRSAVLLFLEFEI